MRAVARLKLGYYPLPTAQGPLIRAHLSFPANTTTSALDPCAGTGAALLALTEGAVCARHAVELDANRAEAAHNAGLITIHGNLFDVRARAERLSLLYLNPPYDFEIGQSGNLRMEERFLSHTFSWLQPKGVLVMVVPRRSLVDCASILATRFKDITAYRLTGQESEQYDQVVIFGVRHNNTGRNIEDTRHYLQSLGRHRTLPELADDATWLYPVPPTKPVEIWNVGLPVDEVEDALQGSIAWRYALPNLLPKVDVAGGRPITPLHAGHVGLLATAGMLNGVFGDGSARHIARWRPVKHTTETTEVEDGVTITRKRERYSNELTLVFANGDTRILTETPKASPAAETGENTVANPAAPGVALRPQTAIFQGGRLAMTPGIQDLIETAQFSAGAHLRRHFSCDWGDVSAEDARANDLALREETRVFSSYTFEGSPDGKVWIITEADRSSTTILLPSEY